MSIKAIARDLYAARLKLEGLQKKLQTAALENQISLQQEVRAAEKELQIMQRMLDGEKESGSYKKRMESFWTKK